MSLHLIKPHYPCEPIGTIAKLAKALGKEESLLRELANNANGMYREVLIKKANKTPRLTFDAQGQLKAVHESIKNRILSRVRFPEYLHGSLKGCDYFTNASLHTNKKFIICEDVQQFFPSISSLLVMDIWKNLFHFSEDVATLLTTLTTKDGAIPQGAKTSSYLANLVFWRDEPLLHAKLAQKGIVYSRYVDDITMSSESFLSKSEQTKVIADVYGMLRKYGLFASRKKGKHQVFSSTQPMQVTKLIVNRKPSLTKLKRAQVRAQVHKATTQSLSIESLNIASQSAGQVGRFHPVEAAKYKKNIQESRNALMLSANIGDYLETSNSPKEQPKS